MKKALIICVAGMSSSLMAKKTTEFFKSKGREIEVEAINATEAGKVVESGAFDLYLISPQAKTHFNRFAPLAEKAGKPIENIPPQAYVPIPMGIEKLANVITAKI